VARAPPPANSNQEKKRPHKPRPKPCPKSESTTTRGRAALQRRVKHQAMTGFSPSGGQLAQRRNHTPPPSQNATPRGWREHVGTAAPGCPVEPSSTEKRLAKKTRCHRSPLSSRKPLVILSEAKDLCTPVREHQTRQRATPTNAPSAVAEPTSRQKVDPDSPTGLLLRFPATMRPLLHRPKLHHRVPSRDRILPRRRHMLVHLVIRPRPEISETRKHKRNTL